MTPQKKMWARKKDRERKRAKKIKEQSAAMPPVFQDWSPRIVSNTTVKPGSSNVADTPGSVSKGNAFLSKQTEYNLTYKVKKALPGSPRKFAKIVGNIVGNATPRKRKALDDLQDERPAKILKIPVQELKSTTAGKSALKQMAKILKNRSCRYLSQNLQLNRRTISSLLSKKAKPKRKTAVNEDHIKDYYKRDDIARLTPGKRYATKDGPGYLMQVSVAAARSKYLAEHPSCSVSLGKFAELRPKNVRKLSKAHREYCCCVYCVNVRYKLLTLSRSVKDTTKKKTSESQVSDIFLCPKSDAARYHKPDCINGSCDDCKDYMTTIQGYYEDIPEKEILKWSRWEKSVVNGQTKKIVVTKTGTKSELLQEFVEHDIRKPSQGINFFQHLHNASWQTSQFQNVKTELPDNWTLQVMDFAKNRGITYQNEIKSVFYSQEQVTMHPVVTYYKSGNSLVRDSSIVISDDHVHDFHAVRHFARIVDDHIAKKRGTSPEKKVIFSDGCSAQYKSKGPFADLSLDAANICSVQH